MRTAKFRRDQKGQTLVIVALMIVVLLGFTGLVTDIAWYEVNLMRIQRAADAAALAGVVYLPGNAAGAQTAAQQEASKNGYATGANGVTVTATPEALNNRILGVTVASPVRSWFARLFGINQFSASRNALAEFVLPVPMGSPELSASPVGRSERHPRSARLLRRRRGTRHRAAERRRVFDLLQREPGPQHGIRPERLPVHRRIRSRHDQWQRVAVRPDVLRDRRRYLERAATRCRRLLVPQRRHRHLDRLQPARHDG